MDRIACACGRSDRIKGQYPDGHSYAFCRHYGSRAASTVPEGTAQNDGRDAVSAPSALHAALMDIASERARQETLLQNGKFSATCATTGEHQMTDDLCYVVLGEEVGEVGRAILDARDCSNDQHPGALAHLREELIQVAAVAVAWVERLDAA